MKQHLAASDKVKSILQRFPEARDNNRYCNGIFWVEQLKEEGINIDTLTVRQFLRMMADKKLKEASVIDRASRIIQVENKDLRGKDFQKRRSKKKRDETLDDLNEVKRRVSPLNENYEKKKELF